MKHKYDSELIKLIIACGLFAAVFVLDKIFELYTVFPGKFGWVFSFVCFFGVYLILGAGIIKNALLKIFKGELLDENFLMMAASFGAFALGIYNGCLGMEPEGLEEGCAVVVFYSIGEYFQEWAQKRSDKKIENLIEKNADRVSEKELEELENVRLEDTKAGSFIARFARVYTPVVVGLAVITAVAFPLYGIISGWTATGESSSFVDYRWSTWIYRGLNFLVVSCPCALVISIPLAFFTGIARAGKSDILLKGSNCLELLSKAKIYVSQKGEKFLHKKNILSVKSEDLNNILKSKSKKEVVVFVGGKADETGYLEKADVGISVGNINYEYASKAADMAFVKCEDDIAVVKRIADRTMRIIRENIVFTIGIKVAVLVLSAFGITNMWFAVFADVGALMLAVLNSLRVGVGRR